MELDWESVPEGGFVELGWEPTPVGGYYAVFGIPEHPQMAALVVSDKGYWSITFQTFRGVAPDDAELAKRGAEMMLKRILTCGVE